MDFREIVFSVAGSDSQKAFEVLEALPSQHLLPDERPIVKLLIRSFKKSGRFVSYKFLCERFGTVK